MAGYDASGGDHPPVLDTADLPPESRLKIFRDLYSERVMPVRIDPVGDEPFWCRIVSAEFGQVSVSEVAGSPMRCEYEQSDADRADAGLIVDVVLRGSYRLDQNGRQALGREGGGLLMHSQIAPSPTRPVGSRPGPSSCPRPPSAEPSATSSDSRGWFSTPTPPRPSS